MADERQAAGRGGAEVLPTSDWPRSTRPSSCIDPANAIATTASSGPGRISRSARASGRCSTIRGAPAPPPTTSGSRPKRLQDRVVRIRLLQGWGASHPGVSTLIRPPEIRGPPHPESSKPADFLFQQRPVRFLVSFSPLIEKMVMISFGAQSVCASVGPPGRILRAIRCSRQCLLPPPAPGDRRPRRADDAGGRGAGMTFRHQRRLPAVHLAGSPAPLVIRHRVTGRARPHLPGLGESRGRGSIQ